MFGWKGFFSPYPHLSIVKHFSGVHVFEVGLHLILVAGGDIDGCAYFLLSIKLAGVGGDVGSKIPFDMEGCECPFLFDGGDDTPFCVEVFENCLMV